MLTAASRVKLSWLAFALAAATVCSAQGPNLPQQSLPDAPQPQIAALQSNAPQAGTSQADESQSSAPQATTPQSTTPQTTPQPTASGIAQSPRFASLLSAEPCLVKNTGATMAATAAVRALAVSGLGVVSPRAGSTPVSVTLCLPHMPLADWYARFLNGPEVKQLTPAQKAYLAAHNLLDPFNLLTIAGEAAISVAANSHSSYGPGVPGWARYMGVSFTQDMTGEFFGTFLIPSIVHQDPHYHRMPTATIKHRIFHAAFQVLWTQGDNGQGMVNYANIVGFALDDAVGDLYVPGQRTNLSSSASRYFIGLATAPIDNYVSEFLPDVARHLHIQIVVIQRVINQVARSDNTAQ